MREPFNLLTTKQIPVDYPKIIKVERQDENLFSVLPEAHPVFFKYSESRVKNEVNGLANFKTSSNNFNPVRSVIRDFSGGWLKATALSEKERGRISFDTAPL